MIPEDLREMNRRLEEEYLLNRYGFEPVVRDAGEVWILAFGCVPELWTREHALERIEEVRRLVS